MPVLFIDPTDFSVPPYGNGLTAVAASAIRVLGDRLHIVGSTSKNHKIGEWTTLEMNGREIPFLPVIHLEKLSRPLIKSANAQFAIAVAKYCQVIESTGIVAVLTRTYTVLWWLVFYKRKFDICFYYPGLGNPMLIGRHPRIGRLLAPAYERLQAMAISRVNVAFAAASRVKVEEYNEYLRALSIKTKVRALPTAVNLEMFRPISRLEARKLMGLPPDARIYTFVGRLAAVKGIPLLFDSLKEICRAYSNTMLLVVGDGEERENLKAMATSMGIDRNVLFLGKLSPDKVVSAIACANACVVGSYVEGFSNAMVEQIACGRPIVSTDVSGATDLIVEGKNGFIVRSRSPKEFSDRMLDAVDLLDAERVSRKFAVEQFSENILWKKVQEAWPPLRA